MPRTRAAETARRAEPRGIGSSGARDPLVPVKGEGVRIAYATDEPLRLECQAFLDAIRSRVPPLTNGESGLRVLRVLQAAQRSLITQGQPVMLPME